MSTEKRPFQELWPRNCRRPILGVAAFSGTGKTTLLKAVLPLLTAKGIRVALIKRSHHNFDLDKPGKDSYELRKAGAEQTVIASAWRQVWICETPGAPEPTLEELIGLLDQDSLELILIEGYRGDCFPKLELHRRELGHPLLYPNDPAIVALASDLGAAGPTDRPHLDINDPRGVASFIIHKILGCEALPQDSDS